MSFDKTKPTGATPLKTADDQIRANFEAIETAIDKDHDFTTGSTQTGSHDKVTFTAPLAVKPTLAASEGGLYTKDVSAKAELHFEDEDGDEIQLTSGGKLNAITGATAAVLRILQVYLDFKYANTTANYTVSSIYQGESVNRTELSAAATSITIPVTGDLKAVLGITKISQNITLEDFPFIGISGSVSGVDLLLQFTKDSGTALEIRDFIDGSGKFMYFEVTYLTSV